MTIKQAIIKVLSKPALAALDWLSMVRENEELRRTIRALEHRIRENGYGFTRLEGTVDALSGRLGAAEKGHSDALGELQATNEALGRAIVECDAFEERALECEELNARQEKKLDEFAAMIEMLKRECCREQQQTSEAYTKIAEANGRLRTECELHEQTRAALAGETNETEMLQVELDEARTRIADLESQLSARADWRPRREMPEGWRVERDAHWCIPIGPNTVSAAVSYTTALALAAYLDTEGV